MRVLVIDNNIDPDSWGSPDLRRMVRECSNATIYCRRAPHEDLPLRAAEFDKIIVSGSKTSALDDAPWISALHGFMREAINEGKALLGICYGHQSLIRALGPEQNQGREFVRRAARAEFGWTLIRCTESTPLLAGLPGQFYSFSSHFDEVAQLPPGMSRFACSQDCEIQACQLKGRPVFGVQFHPEKDLNGAIRTLAYRKKVGTPETLLHPERSEELYDSKVGETLFRNFLNL